MSDPRLDQALRDLEVTANNFALRTIKMAEVRSAYVQEIANMSRELRAAVANGDLSARRGAEIASEMRNTIMDAQRARDFDLGRAYAERMKARGLTFDEAITKAMKKLGFEGRPFESLTGAQQRQVYEEVIEASGRSRPGVTKGIPRLRWAARGLWLATVLVAGYNIGTADNPWWQTGREAANIGGGVAGGFAGGAAMGAAGGIWAGPPGVIVGVLVGGILGALLTDHAYVEAVGTSDPRTRSFVDRFTGFWTGVDEAGMARALAREHRHDMNFVQQVLASLYHDYSTDADDVVYALVGIMRADAPLAAAVRARPDLRDLMIQLLDEGWTSGGEREAIRFLRE